jgi:hypothetical protein
VTRPRCPKIGYRTKVDALIAMSRLEVKVTLGERPSAPVRAYACGRPCWRWHLTSKAKTVSA